MTEHKKDNVGPLSGIRILDLSSVVMGPFATQILADLGADVIKVESPSGDTMRAVGPMRNAAMGALFLHLNRNKRSVVLDLKTPAGQEACLQLIRESDVLLYNLRPAAMARLGLNYERVAVANPAIVYVGAYGFGEDGPYAGRPAYDDLIQGMTGLGHLYQQQSGDVPRYTPLTLCDRTVGLHVAVAVLAGVIEARQSGHGQAIEIPMFEAMAHFVLGDHLGGHSFEPALGPTGYARLLAKERKPYQTSDGFLVLLIYNDKHWTNFFSLIGQPELQQDPRFSSHSARAIHIGEVYDFVASQIKQKDTAYWLHALRQVDIPAAPLYSIEQLIDDEHLQAVQHLQHMEHPTEGPICTPSPLGKYSRTPLSIRRHAPSLGEHTAQVLAELGYSEQDIQAMLASVHPSPREQIV
ncbi:CoA transferase [Alcaligenes faecalis]|uniref:CaiB/BaiF CoA transferase family protein n=1 Tax=Alcaligenes faecalis TaxID=511 RepID=UPI00137B9F0A|nr:CoA transferase [Alcaligenes faecalis]QHS34979.1 CoA transferase [Alcaligenes faecalis]